MSPYRDQNHFLVPAPSKGADDLLQIRRGEAGVDGGRVDAEMLLKGPQISAGPAQQLDAAAMAKRMRMKLGLHGP